MTASDVNEAGVRAAYATEAEKYVQSAKGQAAVRRLIESGTDASAAAAQVREAYVNEEIAGQFVQWIERSGGDVYGRLVGEKKSAFARAVQKIAEFFRSIAAKLRGTDAKSARQLESVADRIMSAVEDFAGDEGTETKTDVPAGSETQTREDGGKRYSLAYQNAAEDSGILDLIQKVKSGESKHDEFANLGIVPDDVAQRIYEITGIDVHGFKSAIEARQIEHIIKDHGENGQTDHSMALDSDIAKLRFTLDAPDDIRAAGRTNAYSTKPTPQGFSRSAKTVLYEKSIGSKSYYAVQAVPDTKKRTLYIVTAFIGEGGYKKEGVPQLTDTYSPGATSEIASMDTPKNSISHPADSVNREFEESEKKFSRNVPRYDYSKSFAEQIDDFKKGLLPKYDTFIVCKTPEVFQKIGMNALPMTYTQKHLKEILSGNVPDHDFGEENIRRIPSALESPVAVFASSTNPSSRVVAILDLSYNGKPMFAAVEIDGTGRMNGELIDSNALTSVHTRKNAANLLNAALVQELNGNASVFYIDKAKATQFLRSSGVQFPRVMSIKDGYVHSIRDPQSNVKGKIANVTETKQFKRWFGDWQNHPETASKVVNADGTPRVVYHGTNADFWTFDLNRSGSNFGDVAEGLFFFTNKKNGYQDSASDYARNAAKNGGEERVLDCYLDIKKPLRLDSKGYFTPTAYFDQNAEDVYAKYLYGDYDGIIIENSDKNADDSVIYLLDDSARIKSATDNIGTFDGGNPDIRYSKALDREYMDAVQSGDVDKAREMVREAAKDAGYTRLFFHGSKNGGGFTVFRDWQYFTENREYAKRYANRENPGSLYETYVKMENPFDTRIPEVRELFKQARQEYGMGELQENGLPDWTDGYDIADYIDENDLPYDGIILDEGGDMVNGKPVSRGMSYVIRNSSQVKSADAITYDANGNVIPLSERFNSEKDDIRWSKVLDKEAETGYNDTTDTKGGLKYAERPGEDNDHARHGDRENVQISEEGSREVGGNRHKGSRKIKSGSLSADVISPGEYSAEQRRVRQQNFAEYGAETQFYTDATHHGEPLSEVLFHGNTIYAPADGYDSDTYTYTDGTASYTEERFDHLINLFSVPDKSANKDYAKAYVAYISPSEFLSLTAPQEDRIVHEARDWYGRLDEDTLANTRDGGIFLDANFETGEVDGHEGRHRMALLRDAGIERVAVVIRDSSALTGHSDRKYNTKKLDSLTLNGQQFLHANAAGSVTLHDVLPLSPRYRAEVREKFVDNGDASIRYSKSAASREAEIARLKERIAEDKDFLRRQTEKPDMPDAHRVTLSPAQVQRLSDKVRKSWDIAKSEEGKVKRLFGMTDDLMRTAGRNYDTVRAENEKTLLQRTAFSRLCAGSFRHQKNDGFSRIMAAQRVAVQP